MGTQAEGCVSTLYWLKGHIISAVVVSVKMCKVEVIQNVFLLKKQSLYEIKDRVLFP